MSTLDALLSGIVAEPAEETGPARSAIRMLHGVLFEGWHTDIDHAVAQENRSDLAELARDVFGNPFRPVAFVPEWLTADVALLARGIWDEAAFDRMPILADALQDAGCDNDDLLVHCRDADRLHVRGCWAIDLILGTK
jgi:hypothetical protein